MEANTIDISGLDKAKVLAALYNRAKPQGMEDLIFNSYDMTEQDANSILSERRFKKEDLYFDYLQGRVIKIDLGKNVINTARYDRDNGELAALSALYELLP